MDESGAALRFQQGAQGLLAFGDPKARAWFAAQKSDLTLFYVLSGGQLIAASPMT